MNELKRVILSRRFVFTLLLLTALGTVLFLLRLRSSDIDKHYPAVYTERYHALLTAYRDTDPELISSEELEARKKQVSLFGMLCERVSLFGEDEVFHELLRLYPEAAEAYRQGALQKYLDEPLLARAEEAAYETLIAQISYLTEFNSYYSTIKKNAARMEHTTLFGDPSSFAYRNIMKTVRDFSAIDGACGTLGDDRPVTSVLDDQTADYLLLIFMAFVALLLLAERKDGLWQLVRATAKGRARLAGERIFVLFICSLPATLLLFGSRILIARAAYGVFHDGERLIQSVQGMNGIPYPLTIWQFLLIYLGIRLLCTFFIGLLLYFLISSVRNLKLSLVITAAVLALEYTLYSTVRDSSILVPLKYINIFQLIVPKNFVINYLNLNLFEHPVGTRAVVSLSMSALSLAAAGGIVLVHCVKFPVGKLHPLEKLLDAFRKKTYRLVFLQESGKVLLAQKGILVLFLCGFVFFSFRSVPNPTVSGGQLIAVGYYHKYAGSVSEETLVSMEADIEKVLAEIQKGTDSSMAVIYQQTLDGLRTLQTEAQDILKRNASGTYTEEIKLLPPFTYMVIFGSGSRSFEIRQGLKALALIVLFTAGMYTYERKSKMTLLLRSLPAGRGRLYGKKEGLTFVFSLFVFIAVYLPEIITLAGNDLFRGFSYFSYPMQGLSLLRESRLPFSVGALTVLVYLIRLLVIFLAGSAVGLISNFFHSMTASLIVTAAVFVGPACACALGVESLYPFTPLPLLFVSGALFYRELVPALIHLVLLLIMIGINACLNDKRKHV